MFAEPIVQIVVQMLNVHQCKDLRHYDMLARPIKSDSKYRQRLRALISWSLAC